MPMQYLNFSIDNVLYALPESDLKRMMEGKSIEREGYDYSKLIQGYHFAMKALLESDCHLIVDNAWVDENTISELNSLLSGHEVIRIGVKCDLAVCELRERARGDRAIGLAKWEYPRVHKHMVYDATIDTSDTTPIAAAKQILDILEVKYV